MAIQNINNAGPQVLPNNAKTNVGDTEGKKAEKTQLKAGLNAYKQTAANNPPTVKDAANVQISQKAKEMNLAKKILDETPDVREDKVAKFKDLIAKGAYNPDSGNIADGILKEALKDELAKHPDIILDN